MKTAKQTKQIKTRFQPIGVFLALMIGCAARHECARPKSTACVSPCGMLLSGSVDCEGFAAQESRAVEALTPYYAAQNPARDVCEQLCGWHVQRLPTHGNGGWVDRWGRRVSGLTWCDYRIVQITAEGEWHDTSLSHEIAHVAECWTPYETNENHDSWKGDGGVYSAIARADAAPDAR